MAESVQSIPNLEYIRPLYLTLLLVGGCAGLSAIVLTALLSRRASCHPTTINFCVTLIIFSVSYSLSAFFDRVDEEHHAQLCMAQASMVQSAPPMAIVAGISVVVQLWNTARQPPSRYLYASQVSVWTHRMIMLSPPYIFFLLFMLVTLVLGIEYPDLVKRENGLYCSLQLQDFTGFVVPIFCSVMIFIVLGFEAAIGFIFWQRRTRIKMAYPLAEQKPSPSMCMRVAFFTAYSLITLIAYIVFMTDVGSPMPYMIQATIPLIAFVVFGTQRDILHAWRIGKPRQELHVVVDNSIQDHQARQHRLSSLSAVTNLDDVEVSPITFASAWDTPESDKRVDVIQAQICITVC